MLFTCEGRALNVAIEHLYVAGWTGRNAAAVQHHIDELAELGIAPPSQTPLFYRAANSLLTHEPLVDVLGDASSGEIEPLVVHHDGALYLGLASDHTDRELEAHSVAASKQACVKPAASELWKFTDIEDHLEDLQFTCHIFEEGDWVLYQKGKLSAILPLRNLIEKVDLPANAAMLCGTFGALGGVRPAQKYRMSLTDARRGKCISFEYETRSLAVVS